MGVKSGRHFLQIPGPTNVPDRVLRAISYPTIDHRGPRFAALAQEVLAGTRRLFQTQGAVVVFPSSGTGAWEASLVNTLSPEDRVLMFETGHFATLWRGVAERLGLAVTFLPGDWRHPADPEAIERVLLDDRDRAIAAVAVVHNETSTGVRSDIPAVRAALDAARHPALLLVDTISSLGSLEYRHDAWGVDVTVGCSQKGLMLPPGLGFNAVSEKALAASRAARCARAYWDWAAMLRDNAAGFFPYTPATNLLFGLREAIQMLEEEGLKRVIERHARLAEATRRAVRGWGLDILCADPQAYSDTLTGILLPEGHDADRVRQVILDRFDLSLGAGRGKLRGEAFRIGHLGDLNDLTLAGTLCGVEMGLDLAGVPHTSGGVQAALEHLRTA
jgi:alanine-glyoxylate transaminase/serine-glyoxylate transaminase/serine-pyruvate transaminase